MKNGLNLVLFVVLTTTAAVNSFAQEFTLTTSRSNLTASRARIDLPGLVNNPDAIIVATPLGDTARLNPHPIGAWYNNDNWNIFYTNHASMPAGLTFNVEVFLKPDDNHFLHVVAKKNLVGGVSYIDIDNKAITQNPNARIKIFQNHAPGYRSASLNNNEAVTEYDPNNGTWYIKNVGGAPLYPNTAYNIVITSGGGSSAGPEAISIPKSTVTPKTLVPNSSAGGDLSGNYPNPNVVGLYGRPLSSTQPKVGDTLRWDGTQWMPSGNTLANGAIAFNGDTGQTGQVLTSNGPLSPPTWKQSPSGGTGGLKTYFKSGSASPNGEFSGSQTFNAANLAHSIPLDKKSRLIISAAIGIYKKFCVVCGPATAVISVRIDNQEIIWGPSSTDIETGGYSSGAISNYMVDLDPGTHKIEIWVFKRNLSSDFTISQNYSSIMVIPIE